MILRGGPFTFRSLACAGLCVALPAQGAPNPLGNLDTTATNAVLDAAAGVIAGSFSIAVRDVRGELEVWRTDGTAAGTSLLRALPGGAFDPFTSPGPVGRNGLVFFVGPAADGRATLWVTDGTTAGTAEIGGVGRDPRSFAIDSTTATTRVWFTATDATNGRELWRSDGTAAGTVRITQVAAGSADGVSGDESVVAALPGFVYFAGQNSTSGMELFRFNGTLWSQFANLATGSASSNPRGFVASGDHLMFFADGVTGTEPYCVALGALQTIDVFPGATGSSPNAAVAYQPASSQPIFYFGARGNTGNGQELWRYDPSTQALAEIDVVTGSNGSNAYPLFQLGARVACSSSSGLLSPSFVFVVVGGGTTATTLVNSPGAGATAYLASASPARMLIDANGLWRSDGTVAGTVSFSSPGGNGEPALLPGSTGCLLRSGSVLNPSGTPAPVPITLPPMDIGSSPTAPVQMPGGTVLFTVAGQMIYRRTGVGAVPLHHSSNTLQLLQASDFSPLFQGRRWFVAAPSGGGGLGIYSTDGTSAGTHLELSGFIWNLAKMEWAVVGGSLLGFCGSNVYAIDGISTQQVASFNQLSVSNSPLALGAFALYSGRDGAGDELWRTNGTAAGTFRVRDINPGAGSGCLGGMVALNATTALFPGDNGSGKRLWRTDGSSPGTTLVTTGLLAPVDIEIFAATTTGRAIFAASSLFGREMFVTDGTNAGTTILLDDATGTVVDHLAPCNGKWLYTNRDADGARLYATDGTPAGTSLVTTLPAGAIRAGTRLHAWSSSGQVVLFMVGNRLYRSDGTAAGTFAMGATISPFDVVFAPSGADTAVFAAYDDAGRELWRTDGTVAGTTRHADLNPGTGSSRPGDYASAGGLVYFSADDGLSGREPWAMPTMPTVTLYGTGCPGTGNTVPTIDVTSPARLGANLQIALGSALPNSVAVQCLGLDAVDIPIGGDCSVLLSIVVNNAVPTGPAGSASQLTVIPNDPAFVGISVFSQFAVLDPNGAFAAFLSMTAGVEARVGI